MKIQKNLCFFVLFSFVFLFTSCQNKKEQHDIVTKIDEKNKYREVGRKVVTVENENSYLNGVIISEVGHLITSYHGLSDKENITIKTYNNGRYVAEYIAEFPVLDLMLFKIKSNKKWPYAKMKKNLNKDNNVVVLARDQNGTLNLIEGSVLMQCQNLSRDMLGLNEGIIEPMVYRNATIHTAPLKKGYSGSMLVNSSAEFIGVNHGFFKKEKVQLNLASINYAEMNQAVEIAKQVKQSWYQSVASVERQRLKWLIDGFEDKNDKESTNKCLQIQENVELFYEKLGYHKTVNWVWREFFLFNRFR
jgi:hypothetical protein